MNCEWLRNVSGATQASLAQRKRAYPAGRNSRREERLGWGFRGASDVVAHALRVARDAREEKAERIHVTEREVSRRATECGQSAATIAFLA